MQHPLVRRRTGVVACALALGAVFGATSVADAQSSTEPVVNQNLPTVSEHAARGGAAHVPGVQCGSQCADWWAQEHRPIANQPTSEQLHRELRNLRGRARVLPALRVLGTIGLAAGTFELGWKIGTGINAKFLHIGIPEPPDVVNVSPAFSIRFQSPRWVLYNYSRWNWYPGWRAPDAVHQYCDPYGLTTVPAAPFREEIFTTNNSCTPPGGPTAYTNGVRYVIPEDELSAPSAGEDYVGQPYTKETTSWSGTPTSAQQLQDLLRAGLASGDFPLAEAWYAQQLDPRNHDEATDEDEDCALPDDTGGEDPGVGRGTGDTGEEFLRRYERAPADVFPTAGLPSSVGTAYLNWGWTSPNLDNSHVEWRGWGYRKIKAKHGWTPADLDATRAALLSPPISHPTISGRYTFIGDEYSGQNSARCKRVVVVEYERNQDEVEKNAPHSAGMLTSFGQKIG